MPERDWDAEMRKIDQQLERVSDEALLPAPAPARGAPPPPRGAAPAVPPALAEQRRTTSTFGVLARLVLVTLAAVALLFWPYARCGGGLAGYLGAAAVVALGGVWTAVWSWRHRAARAHVISLILLVWGLVLAAGEVLPRVGYALPTADRPAVWTCS